MNVVVNQNNKTITSKKGNVRLLVLINIVATVLVIAFEMTPILERTASNFVRLPLWGAWVVSAFVVPKIGKSLFNYKFLGWWFLYVAWIGFMFLIGHSNESIREYISRMPLYSIPIMLIISVKYYRPDEMKLLWLAILAIFLYSLVDNMIFGMAEPEIYNRMHEFDRDSTWATNAGGTTHIVQCLFMCPIFWYISQNTEHRLVTLLAIGYLAATSYYMMFINNRTTSLLIWLYMAGMFFLSMRRKYQYKSMWSLVKSSLVMLVVVAIFAAPLFELLISVFSESERMSNRLNELLVFSGTQTIDASNEESLYARYILWMTSITTFFSSIPNLLIGVGEDVHQGDIFGLIRCGVGYHSEFFDLAAKYGIIGIILVYNSLKYLFNFIRGLCGTDKERTMLNIFLIGFIIYSFLNNTFRESTFFVAFIFMPLTIMMIRYKKI